MSARKRLAVVGAVWLLGSGITLLAPGCYGRECEGEVETYGADTSQGNMVDPNTWQSSPFDGTWLHFPAQRYYRFEIPQLGGRTPYNVQTFLSPEKTPVPKGQGMAPGGGNLTEIFAVRPNGIDIRNGTCAEYYLRVVVSVAPFPPGTDPDSGLDVDASDEDASNDAGADATSDAPDGD